MTIYCRVSVLLLNVITILGKCSIVQGYHNIEEVFCYVMLSQYKINVLLLNVITT